MRPEEKKGGPSPVVRLEATERLRRLIAGMAHHYNNLHAIIQGHADLLTERLPFNDPIRDDLEVIQRCVSRASAITHRLTAAAERLVLRPAVFNLNNLLESLRLELVRLAGPGRQLEIRLTPDPGLVRADPSELRQIVLELAKNAFEAMDGTGMLTLESSNQDLDIGHADERFAAGDLPCVTVSMTDTGQGLVEEAEAHLFEPFFTTKASQGAAGLGLAACKGGLRQSGGQLWLRSTGPGGTTFTFALPRLAPSASEDRLAAESECGDSAEKRALTVLVVEDEDTHRNLIRHVLQRSGWEVLEARNGTEALMLCDFHKGSIHLILSDVTMPEMGGIEFRDRLAQIHPQMPIVFMSGYTREMLTDRGTLLPGAEFVQKPFSSTGLLQTLRSALDKYRR